MKNTEKFDKDRTYSSLKVSMIGLNVKIDELNRGSISVKGYMQEKRTQVTSFWMLTHVNVPTQCIGSYTLMLNQVKAYPL